MTFQRQYMYTKMTLTEFRLAFRSPGLFKVLRLCSFDCSQLTQGFCPFILHELYCHLIAMSLLMTTESLILQTVDFNDNVHKFVLQIIQNSILDYSPSQVQSQQ